MPDILPCRNSGAQRVIARQVMDYPIDGRLAGCTQCRQRPGPRVGAQVDQHQQHCGCQRQTPRPPGMLVEALTQECAVTGGTLARAGNRATAMSQHCLCGQRAPKTLAQRTHDCPHCGLHADRDTVSAVLRTPDMESVPDQ